MDDLYRIEYGHWAASPYGRSVFKALNATPFGLPEMTAQALAGSANLALRGSQKVRYRAAKITGFGHAAALDLPERGDYYKAFGVPCRVEEVHVQPDPALRRTGYAMVAVTFRYRDGFSIRTHPVGLDEFRKSHKRDLNPAERIHCPKLNRNGSQKPWHELKIGRPTGAEIPAAPKVQELAHDDKLIEVKAFSLKPVVGKTYRSRTYGEPVRVDTSVDVKDGRGEEAVSVRGRYVRTGEAWRYKGSLMGWLERYEEVSRDTDGPFFTKYEGGVPVTRDAADATFAKLCGGPIPMSSRYHQPAFHSTDQADALGPVTFTGNIPSKPPPTPKVEPKPGQVWRRIKPDSVYLGQEWTVRRACSGGFSFAPLLGRRGTVWTRLSNIHRHWEFVRETEKPSVFMWLGGDGEA